MRTKTIRKGAWGLAVIAALGILTGGLIHTALQKVLLAGGASAQPVKTGGKPVGDATSDAWWTVSGKNLSSNISQVARRAAAPLKHTAKKALAAVDTNVVRAGTGGSSSFHQTTVAVVPGGPIAIIGGGSGSTGGGSGGGGGSNGGGGGSGGGSNGGGSGGGSGGGTHNIPESGTAALFASAIIGWNLRRRFRKPQTAAMTFQKAVEHPQQP